MDNHGHIRLTGALNSKIGKVHKFVVHAEHTESRKGYDYSEPMSVSGKDRKPKEVVNHEFRINKVSPVKSFALNKRVK